MLPNWSSRTLTPSPPTLRTVDTFRTLLKLPFSTEWDTYITAVFSKLHTVFGTPYVVMSCLTLTMRIHTNCNAHFLLRNISTINQTGKHAHAFFQLFMYQSVSRLSLDYCHANLTTQRLKVKPSQWANLTSQHFALADNIWGKTSKCLSWCLPQVFAYYHFQLTDFLLLQTLLRMCD